MGLLARAAPPLVHPSELYIVREGTSDMMPGWFHSLMIVKSDGRDLVVKYVRVAPNQFCEKTVTVQADAIRLHDTTMADLIRDNNPCAISARRVRQEIRKNS